MRGREPLHVRADLRHQGFGDAVTDPENRIQALDCFLIRAHALDHLGAHLRDGRIQDVDVRERLGDQQALVRPDPAGACSSSGSFSCSRPLAS